MPETVERCVSCGCTELVSWKQIADWSIDKCNDCGLAVLNPHPTDTEMFETYNGYWGYPPKPTDSAEKAREVAHQTARVKQINRFKSPGRWLDVGAGAGTLLVRARQDGWDVYGCEIAKHLVEYAVQEYDLTLYEGGLQTYEAPFKFDVITLYHILEHVASPTDLLQAARARLAKDGLLAVEVPNITSLDARLAGENWKGWALPVHFFHFTPKTLVDILTHQGFQVDYLYYCPSRHFNAWWAKLIRCFVPASAQNRLLSGDAIRAFAHKIQPRTPES